jgi:hypothetical protein
LEDYFAVILPTSGDLKRMETTDMAAQLYLVWSAVPASLRLRIIGYVEPGDSDGNRREEADALEPPL